MLEYIILVCFALTIVFLATTLVRKGFKSLYLLLCSAVFFVFGIIGQCTVMSRETAEEEPLGDGFVFAHILWTPQQELLYKVSEWAIYLSCVVIMMALIIWLIHKLRKP